MSVRKNCEASRAKPRLGKQKRNQMSEFRSILSKQMSQQEAEHVKSDTPELLAAKLLRLRILTGAVLNGKIC